MSMPEPNERHVNVDGPVTCSGLPVSGQAMSYLSSDRRASDKLLCQSHRLTSLKQGSLEHLIARTGAEWVRFYAALGEGETWPACR